MRIPCFKFSCASLIPHKNNMIEEEITIRSITITNNAKFLPFVEFFVEKIKNCHLFKLEKSSSQFRRYTMLLQVHNAKFVTNIMTTL